MNHSPEMIQFDEWRKLAGISKLELVWDSTNSLMTANMIAYDQAQAYLLSNNKQFISAYKNQKYSKQRHLINIRKIMDISPIEK